MPTNNENPAMVELLRWVKRAKREARKEGVSRSVLDTNRARCLGQMDGLDWVEKEIARRIAANVNRGESRLAPARGSASEAAGEKPCPRCGGSGRVQDDSQIGVQMRKVRGAMSLRELGSKLGFSAAYLSDLELGRRGWSVKLQEDYRKHCNPLPLTPNAKLIDDAT